MIAWLVSRPWISMQIAQMGSDLFATDTVEWKLVEHLRCGGMCVRSKLAHGVRVHALHLEDGPRGTIERFPQHDDVGLFGRRDKWRISHGPAFSGSIPRSR